jgi:hypothetical protein
VCHSLAPRGSSLRLPTHPHEVYKIIALHTAECGLPKAVILYTFTPALGSVSRRTVRRGRPSDRRVRSRAPRLLLALVPPERPLSAPGPRRQGKGDFSMEYKGHVAVPGHAQVGFARVAASRARSPTAHQIHLIDQSRSVQSRSTKLVGALLSETAARPNAAPSKRERRQVGPEVGPTSASSRCIPTGMHGPACIFWAT